MFDFFNHMITSSLFIKKMGGGPSKDLGSGVTGPVSPFVSCVSVSSVRVNA